MDSTRSRGSPSRAADARAAGTPMRRVDDDTVGPVVPSVRSTIGSSASGVSRAVPLSTNVRVTGRVQWRASAVSGSWRTASVGSVRQRASTSATAERSSIAPVAAGGKRRAWSTRGGDAPSPRSVTSAKPTWVSPTNRWGRPHRERRPVESASISIVRSWSGALPACSSATSWPSGVRERSSRRTCWAAPSSTRMAISVMCRFRTPESCCTRRTAEAGAPSGMVSSNRSPTTFDPAPVRHSVATSPSAALAGRYSGVKEIGLPYEVACTVSTPGTEVVRQSSVPSGNTGRRLSDGSSRRASGGSTAPNTSRTVDHRRPCWRLPSVMTSVAPPSSAAVSSSGSSEAP